MALSSVDADGRAWKENFQATWSDYRQWYLCEGESARPRYPACVKALETHMPELVPLFHRLEKWAGGSDLAARFLSLYKPPPYMAGCTQAVWQGPAGALLNAGRVLRPIDISKKTGLEHARSGQQRSRLGLR